MQGLMMQMPLMISALLTHAEKNHADTEIVSRTVEGDIHRYTYRDLGRRSRQLANALKHLKVKAGDRVATIAWNGYRHMELYYAVSGSGAIIHTINPRLFPEQLLYIINHAEDGIIFFDLTFTPLVEKIAPHCPNVRAWVAMTDHAHLPPAKIENLLCYEDLVDAEKDDYVWPTFDENTAACLCYTSGTTGNPKGVLYSHRSTVLHGFAVSLPDVFNMSSRSVILPVVPMFHVNAWGIPYAAPLTGSKLVFPGPALDGASVYQLMEQEKVNYSAGVPTVWLGLLNHLKQHNLKFSTLKYTVIGGSAAPPAMIRSFQEDFGVQVLHAWGMTEMSPLGTLNTPKEKHLSLTAEERFKLSLNQGRTFYGLDLKLIDDDGKELPRDGKSAGHLLVKGQWVIQDYYRNEGGSPLKDGWFPTGDMATIDPDGFLQITDRSKDVIKSGGEWISSIDLENVAMAHPAVAEAGVIGVHHPKWEERPLLVVVKRAGQEVSREDLLKFYEGKIAKWQIPDDVTFVNELPHTATGKISKLQLRQQFKDYKLPG
ncbi:MAG: 3-(methylthio)propionyl-CoA ligase [Burkholderiales bacterium]|nr:3-(methylthio)propionyl-CoA ligase [Burkholderiales bacterium]